MSVIMFKAWQKYMLSIIKELTYSLPSCFGTINNPVVNYVALSSPPSIPPALLNYRPRSLPPPCHLHLNRQREATSLFTLHLGIPPLFHLHLHSPAYHLSFITHSYYHSDREINRIIVTFCFLPADKHHHHQCHHHH